jgi:hypothetical protein
MERSKRYDAARYIIVHWLGEPTAPGARPTWNGIELQGLAAGSSLTHADE